MALVNEHTLGAAVRLSVVFAQSGTAVDPGGVRFKVRPPYGSIVTYTYGTDAALVKDSTGHYHLDYTPSVHGTFTWRAEGITSNLAAGEQEFRVLDSLFD